MSSSTWLGKTMIPSPMRTFAANVAIRGTIEDIICPASMMAPPATQDPQASTATEHSIERATTASQDSVIEGTSSEYESQTSRTSSDSSSCTTSRSARSGHSGPFSSSRSYRSDTPHPAALPGPVAPSRSSRAIRPTSLSAQDTVVRPKPNGFKVAVSPNEHKKLKIKVEASDKTESIKMSFHFNS
ncbi:hypothetical protein BC939DRAFT_259856 [Gamsiella multidivaricata]|uniref:uncharacterized protein n=1 Tax=Gamsiella multidivaricata TaxID=101098 RepID=UPI00221E3AF7|nr:uncharacterized protein BC939DRAFT_259856 [Gamsiella multidivaricata]KAI7830729.1 hypothetical protein BC939DRAFT_259856 [Gamsiella multidivaricata]